MPLDRPNLAWLTLGLAGSMAALFATLGPAPAGLVYDRGAVMHGEWWRLVTGHLVHGDLAHLVWNLVGLLLLGVLLERISRAQLLIALLIGVVVVDVVLVAWLPWLAFYCGLSGVLNALLLPILAAAWAGRPSPMIPLVAVGSFAKILIEMLLGQALVTDNLWPAVPLAHLAGWLGGFMAALCFVHGSTRVAQCATLRRGRRAIYDSSAWPSGSRVGCTQRQHH